MVFTISVDSNTVNTFKLIVEADNLPPGRKNDLIKDVKVGLKMQRIQAQLNLLERAQTKGIATPEVISLSKRTTKSNNKAVLRNEQKRLMKVSINRVNKELAKQKKEFHKVTGEVKVILSKEAYSQYKILKQEQMNLSWKKETEARNKKLNWRISKAKVNQESGVPEVKGVLFSDEELKDLFGEPEVNPAVYGGVELSASAKEFMKLPPKLRGFPDLKIDEVEVETEAVANKQRWGAREVKKNPQQTTEELRTSRDNDYDNRQISNGSRVKFSAVRATDMKHNKHIEMPDPGDPDEEATIQFQKQETLTATKRYISDNCNSKGSIKGASNLTDDEIKGCKEIKEGIKSKGWLLYETDKSGKLCIDTLENYKLAMSKHIEGDQEVNTKKVLSSEKSLNEHARMWTKMVSLGAENNQQDRCKETLTSRYNPIPILSGLRKDHKVTPDPVKGPPLRPVYRARVAPNSALGNIISQMVKGLGDELNSKIGTDSLNSEEVCAEVVKANFKIEVEKSRRRQPNRKAKRLTRREKIFTENIIMGSMDVEALYPSIQWIASCKEMLLTAKESKIPLENFDYTEIARYVSLTCTGPEIRAEKLEEFVPRSNPGASLAKAGRIGDQGELFQEAAKIPGDKEKRSLLGLALSKGVDKVLSNHYYSFNNKVYKQSKGGSIGSELTGEVSRVYMLRWDRKFLKKLDKLGWEVTLYKRYVDDILIAVRGVQPGVRYNPAKGNLEVVEGEIEGDLLIPEDQRTMKVLNDVANSIDIVS